MRRSAAFGVRLELESAHRRGRRPHAAPDQPVDLALYAGLDYDRERYRDVPGTADDTEVLGAVEWDWFEVNGDTELETTLMVLSRLEESRNRAKLDVTLRRDIVRGYYWSVNVYEDYDSDPPADFDDTDFGLGVSIGRAF